MTIVEERVDNCRRIRHSSWVAISFHVEKKHSNDRFDVIGEWSVCSTLNDLAFSLVWRQALR